MVCRVVRRSYAATAALVLALTVVACGDDSSDPSDASSTPSAPSTSASPTEEPSETAMGPVETVRAWVDAYNKVVDTGRTKAVMALSSQSCSSCVDRVEPVAETHRDGGRYEGYQWEIERITADENFSETSTVHTTIRHSAGTTWPSADAEPVSYESTLNVASFQLAKEEGRWVVRTIYRPS